MNLKVCVTPTSLFLFLLACLVEGHVTIAFQQSKPFPRFLHHHPATMTERTQYHYVTTGTVMSDSHNTKYHETCELSESLPQTNLICLFLISECLLHICHSIGVSSSDLSIFFNISEYLPQTYLNIFFNISAYLPRRI